MALATAYPKITTIMVALAAFFILLTSKQNCIIRKKREVLIAKTAQPDALHQMGPAQFAFSF
jgi:hypothetical protein